MCAASAAAEYWGALGGLAARAGENATAPPPGRYPAPIEPPVFSFEGASLRAYFRTAPGAFSWRSRSQLELALEGEPTPELEPQQLQHQWRLVNQLRGKLRPDVKFQPEKRAPPPPPPTCTPALPEPPIEPPPKASDEGGFIAKLIGNKKSKSGTSEEKEKLVSSEKRCQIVASSDNFFKTDFGSSPKSIKETNSTSTNGKNMSNYKSISGLEEARALLSGTGTIDSFNTSVDSDFHSCEDTPNSATSPSSSTLMLPKTGYDFLDNW